MHRSFANWYSLVDLRADGPTLEARWKAVEAYSKGLREKQVPDLIRMFYCRPCSSGSKDKLSTTEKETDQAFLMDNNDRELSVLAAGVIAELLSGPAAVADAIALAIICMEAQGLRSAGRLQGPAELAVENLAAESVRVRAESEDLRPLLSQSLSKDISALKTPVAQGDTNALQPSVEKALRSITTAMNEYAQSVGRELATLRLQHREESDILWWLFGERTSDGTPFAKLKVEEACLHGPVDLAGFTRLIPGPISVPAFLKRMLRLVKVKLPAAVTITDVIDACGETWKRTLISRYAVQDLADFCPLLFACSKSVEAGSGAWADAFRNTSGLRPDDKLEPSSLALQGVPRDAAPPRAA
jgi:hypothetical protein